MPLSGIHIPLKMILNPSLLKRYLGRFVNKNSVYDVKIIWGLVSRFPLETCGNGTLRASGIEQNSNYLVHFALKK